ncbi:MAG: sulfatase [Prolixibacteraceae bacterium]
MNRRKFIKNSSLTIVSLMLSTSFSQAQNTDKQPNIIVIVADDVSPAYVGCYGGKTPTPHLDKLATNGAKFTNAYCVSPLCNPSRYNLLTGQFAGRNPNVYENTKQDQQYHLMQSTTWTDSDPSIARTMKNAGYFTGYIGKWHSNFELEGSLEIPSGLDKDAPKTTRLLKKRHDKHVKTVKQISGFDYVDNLSVGNLDGKKKTNPWMGFHNPEWQTQGGLDFISEAVKKDKPFFLHLANSIPHSPDNIKSLEQDNRYTQAGKLDEPLTCHPRRKTVVERLKKAGLNTNGPIGSINAGTIVLDDQLGAIQKLLEEKGILENTIIIWLADHSIYGKGAGYAAGIHVPMIVSWPKMVKPNQEIETPVSLVDLFKTCTAVGDAKLPDDQIDGENLMPLMMGKTSERAPVYQEINWFRGIIKGKYHYVAFRPPQSALEKMQNGEVDYAIDQSFRDMRNIFGDLNLPFKPGYFDADQLYDLEVDPLERNNLAYLPAYAGKVKEMKAELNKILETFERPFPLEVPEFMNSAKYYELVAERKKLAEKRGHYPEKYDAERIFNYNLFDPLAE